MTIDTFVQIVALIAAIYALVPRARQLELRIHLGAWEVIAGIIYFFTTVYLLFYGTFVKLGWAKEWVWEDSHGITPSFVSFWMTLLFVMFSLWRFRAKKLPRKSVFKFQELAEDFLHKEEYSDLMSLLDRYWESLIKIYFGSPFLHGIKTRLKKFIVLLGPEKDFEAVLKVLDEVSNAESRSKIKKRKAPKTWGTFDN